MLVLPLRGEHDGLRLVLQEGSVAYRLIWVGIGECLVLVGGEGGEEYSLICYQQMKPKEQKEEIEKGLLSFSAVPATHAHEL